MLILNIYRSLLFTLCFTHSVVQERRKFGPLGWCVPYEFNDGDLNATIMFLEKHLEQSTLSWSTLQYMAGIYLFINIFDLFHYPSFIFILSFNYPPLSICLPCHDCLNDLFCNFHILLLLSLFCHVIVIIYNSFLLISFWKAGPYFSYGK